jgi:uncharacterized protein (TIGR02147 family)
MSSIFDYSDFRKFLDDYYKSSKKEKSYFSYRYIASRVGFKSAGHFTQILNGQANLSQHLISRFIDFLKFSRREAEYFELLVNFNQAKTQDDKKRYFERMAKYKEIKMRILNPDEYEFYRKWYYAAICDILSFYPFKGDFHELARMVEPAISPAKARTAIELLEKLHLIRANENGVYEKTDTAISAGSQGNSIALTNHAIEMIDLAKDSISRLPKEDRNISWVGVAVSPPTFETIQEEIRALRKRIIAYAQEDMNPEKRVYHFNMQFFPLSKKYPPTGRPTKRASS